MAVVGSDDYSTSWIYRASTQNLKEASLGQKYASSLYWSLTTQLKGKPWVDPDTCTEKAYTIFMVLMGTLAFAMLNANLTAMIQAADQHNKSRYAAANSCAGKRHARKAHAPTSRVHIWSRVCVWSRVHVWSRVQA